MRSVLEVVWHFVSFVFCKGIHEKNDRNTPKTWQTLTP